MYSTYMFYLLGLYQSLEGTRQMIVLEIHPYVLLAYIQTKKVGLNSAAMKLSTEPPPLVLGHHIVVPVVSQI